jgi:uncharacterized membrane protein
MSNTFKSEATRYGSLSISKVVVIIAGVIGLIVGVIIGVYQILMFFNPDEYLYLYPNTLNGVTQELTILLTNIWLALAGIIGGLLFLVPLKMGRSMHVAGYTTPNVEVIPKAYRFGGIYMIVWGILSIIARLLFSNVDTAFRPFIIILPLLIIIIGIIGLLVGLAKNQIKIRNADTV